MMKTRTRTGEMGNCRPCQRPTFTIVYCGCLLLVTLSENVHILFSSFRDRAEERRRGVNPDYAGVDQLASVLGGAGDTNLSRLSVEETKFLGGDIEHTHLVKGLDYALLQKVRVYGILVWP